MSNTKQFYKELGRLLYAVAMADKKIEEEEVQALHEFVSKELALSERASDSSGMNLAFYTDFEFDEYTDKNISVQQAHDSFMKFLDANIAEIDPKLIEKAVKAIEKVASSFKKMSKEERTLIDKIKAEINETADIF